MHWSSLLVFLSPILGALCHMWWQQYRLRGSEPIKVPELELPKEFVYEWVRDDGFLWTGPGDTAFWLEPETCDELAAWCARYRQRDYGLYAVNDDVRIEWLEPVQHNVRSVPISQLTNMLQNAYNTHTPYNAAKHSEWY